MSDVWKAMQRLVHFDLKGGPPKLSYLEQILPCIKKWGATGILIEWEDTFPYSGELANIGSATIKTEGVYTPDEVHRIMQIAKENGLLVIQLVQTIGHMEFVLKHNEFRGLRELPQAPNVLCPLKPESQLLIRTMLEQVLDAQPNAEYIHIGADEVWHYGVCEDCSVRATENKNGVVSIYLQHIRDLSLYIHEKRPNIRILMWDDMLRGINCEILHEYNLGELVEPVVWNYSPVDCFTINPGMWNSYQKTFSHIWIGSAFKGANGCAQIVASSARYVSNQDAWIGVVNEKPCDISFEGVLLTGWSRYDHFATLCELLPVAMPSLASCLKRWTKPVQEQTSGDVVEVLPQSEWPGYSAALAVHSFVLLRNRCLALIHGDEVAAWLNPWQVENKYVNPIQVQGIAIAAERLLKELSVAEENLQSSFQCVMGEKSKDEWIGTLHTPLVKQIRSVYENAYHYANSEVRALPESVCRDTSQI